MTDCYCKCCNKQYADRVTLWKHKQTQKHKRNELLYAPDETDETATTVPETKKEKGTVININNYYINIKNINLILPNGCSMNDCPLPVLEMFQETIKNHIDNWLKTLEYNQRPIHVSNDNVFVKQDKWFQGKEAEQELNKFGSNYTNKCIKYATDNLQGDELMSAIKNITNDNLNCERILQKNKKKLMIKPRQNQKV